MCVGLVNFLISDDIDAVRLREKVVFKIIPMINPDGVVAGNYRYNKFFVLCGRGEGGVVLCGRGQRVGCPTTTHHSCLEFTSPISVPWIGSVL